MAVWSVINKKKLESYVRLDSEYYQPCYLAIENILQQVNAVLVSDVAVNKHRKFKPVFNKIFKYIEISEIDTVTGESKPVNILGQNAPSRAQRMVKKGDVIISTVRPNRNAVSLINEEQNGFVCSTGFAVLKAKKITPEYLFTYLKTKYSINQLERKTTASMYPAVNENDILKSLIFIADAKFQEKIKRLIIEFTKCLHEYKLLYSQAESILLEELGLKDLNFQDDLFYTTTLKKVQENNRMDAEYYQIKYEIIEQKLKPFNQVKLKKLCSLINYGTVPTSPYVKKGIPYIKGLNLVDGFVDDSKLDYLDVNSTNKLPSKFYVKENDIVISQMGTVGKAGIVNKQQNDWLFASFTIRVRLKKDCNINPFYLTFFIEKVSRPYYLLRKIAHASVRQNTDLPTIRDLPVVLITTDKQNLIADKLIKSNLLKQKAKQLLEEAKLKVEKMIEKEATENNGV